MCKISILFLNIIVVGNAFGEFREVTPLENIDKNSIEKSFTIETNNQSEIYRKMDEIKKLRKKLLKKRQMKI